MFSKDLVCIADFIRLFDLYDRVPIEVKDRLGDDDDDDDADDDG